MAQAQIPAGLMQMLMQGMQAPQLKDNNAAGMSFISQNSAPRNIQAPVAPTVQMPKQTDYGSLAYAEGAAKRKERRQREYDKKQQDEFFAGMQGLNEEELRRYMATYGTSAQSRGAGGSMMEEAMFPAQKRALSDYEAFKADNPEGTYDDWQRAKNQHKKPLIQQMGPSNDRILRMTTPEENIAMGKPADAKLMVKKDGSVAVPPSGTDADKKAVSFNTTMQGAESEFDFLNQEFPDFNPASFTSVLKNKLVTGDNELLSFGAAAMQNEQEKMYATSMMDWIGANRAYISGAAVPELEFKRDMQTYFAQPNDSRAMLNLKKKMRMNRQEAIQESMNLPLEERQAFSKRQARNDYRKMMVKMRDEKKKNKNRRASDNEPVVYGNMNDGEDRRTLNKPAPTNWIKDGYEYQRGEDGVLRRRKV